MKKRFLSFLSLIMIFAMILSLPGCKKAATEDGTDASTEISDVTETVGNVDESENDTSNPSLDGDDGNTDDGNTDDGNTDDGNTDDGNTDDGNTDDGNTDDGNTDDGNTDDGNTDDGNTDDGNTDDGNTDDGNTDDGNTDDGNTNDDNTNNDNTDEDDDDTLITVADAPIRNGNKVTFGLYPQSEITKDGLIAKLNAKSADWKLSNGMWYADVENNGNKYRGVRTTESGEATWFRYEPIEWTVLAESNKNALILCNLIIDAKAFSDDDNNYATSTVREWLNAEFLNTAFSELQAEFILTTLVDNGKDSTGYANPRFTCENTNDKIFLISRTEVKNEAYGFLANGATSDAARKKIASAYAIMQIGDAYDASNGAWWWLRTPAPHAEDAMRADLAHTIKINGTINNATVGSNQGGVVPAMWICFEITDGDQGGDDNTGNLPEGDGNGSTEGGDNTGNLPEGDDNTGNVPEGEGNGSTEGGDDNTGNLPEGDDNTDEDDKDELVTVVDTPIRNGNKVTFGLYPQSEITKNGLIAKLNAKSADWKLSHGMWYADVENNGNKYRGVRTTESGEATWFRYEPIEWTVLAESNKNALILCNLIIDAKAFSDDDNNYATSTVREWLNAEFLNTAFSELQAEFILTTLVDNGKDSTGYANPRFTCENTNDKIFLISRTEVKNEAYGFLANGATSDAARKKIASAYAIMQIGDAYDASNGAWWWLRTPAPHAENATRADLAHTIKINGTINNATVGSNQGGIVPAMWICFEIVTEPTPCAHTGGEATCKALAICEECGEPYGELDFDNHKGELVWAKNEEAHSQYYDCCDTLKVESEAHAWENGVCTKCDYACTLAHIDGTACELCGYGCAHSGGNATCKSFAICSKCNTPYGELDASAHEGRLDWVSTDTAHERIYTCCDAVDVASEAHTFTDGVCSECEYACEHNTNEGHACAICAVALGHIYKNGDCVACGLNVDGSTVYFGSYPQSAVSDSDLISALNRASGAWEFSNGMWYADVENNGSKYRGVRKAEDGAATWFIYEPIKWTIVSRDTENNQVLVLCDMIIDAQKYADVTDGNSDNSYADSAIRAWLNASFINTAFDELQREVILTTTVDNTDKVVADYNSNTGNPYLCENTEDKIFLLSKAEIKNGAVKNGFIYELLTDADFSTDASRQKTVTAYAISQGVYADANNGGWWWLRTPYYDYNNPEKDYSAHVIKVSGAINMSKVDTATGGVVPAMWIQL